MITNSLCIVEVTDEISKNVMGGISKQLGKLDKVLEIKSSIDTVSDKVDSFGNQLKDLESIKNKIRHLEQLSSKLEQLDQRFKDSINEISRAQSYQQRFLEEVDARCRRNNIIIILVVATSKEWNLSYRKRMFLLLTGLTFV